MINKFAIVTNGGGMKCAYSVGALCALAEIYDIKKPDIVVASSGSAGSLSCYIAGQYDSIRNIWTNLLASDDFISVKRINPIMNLDYLIDTVLRKKDPLNLPAIQESSTKLFISATDYETGLPTFFTKDDDILLALRASKAIPFITHSKILINTSMYIDGSVGAPIKVNTEKAVNEGAKNILVIMEGGSELPFSIRLFWYIYSFFVNNNLKMTIRNYCSNDSRKIIPHEEVTVKILKPSRRLPTNSLDINPMHLQESFDLGYSDIQDNQEIKEFLLLQK